MVEVCWTALHLKEETEESPHLALVSVICIPYSYYQSLVEEPKLDLGLNNHCDLAFLNDLAEARMINLVEACVQESGTKRTAVVADCSNDR